MWDFPDATLAQTIPDSDKRLRGYEVRIRQNNTVVGCLCLTDPNVHSVELANAHLRYSVLSTMTIEVFTLPFDPSYGESYYSTSQSRSWPSSSNSDGVLLTPAPRINSTLTNSTKELTVSWSHPPTALPPSIYYVYGASRYSRIFSVIVIRALQVTLTGLNSSERYHIWVQGYSHCSGIASFSEGIGCGLSSHVVIEPLTIVGPSLNPTMWRYNHSHHWHHHNRPFHHL